MKLQGVFIFLNVRFYWREDSIKTRIETMTMSLTLSNSWIEEKIPLKQGLKPSCIFCILLLSCYWREDSIKTRIETLTINGSSITPSYWREDSIKTRIETYKHFSKYIKPYIIEEKIPLKQGLKLYPSGICGFFWKLKRRFH